MQRISLAFGNDDWIQAFGQQSVQRACDAAVLECLEILGVVLFDIARLASKPAEKLCSETSDGAPKAFTNCFGV